MAKLLPLGGGGGGGILPLTIELQLNVRTLLASYGI